MLIGELSKIAEVSKHTIRHYEELGLIYSTERIAGSRVYREYPEETLRRLHLINLGKQVGLSLKQLKPLLDSFLEGALSFEQQIEVMETQQSALDEKIAALQNMKQLIDEKLDIVRRKQAGEDIPCQSGFGKCQ